MPSASSDFDPSREILIYDGACSFCKKSVERLERWVGPLPRKVSFRDAEAMRAFPWIDPRACEQGAMLVFHDGSTIQGAQVLLRILSAKTGCRFLGKLYRVAWIRRWVDRAYARLAMSRYKL